VRGYKEKLVAKAMAQLYKQSKKQARAPGFVDSLLAKLKSQISLKMELSVSNVHLRLEDEAEQASVGLIIRSLVLAPRGRSADAPATAEGRDSSPRPRSRSASPELRPRGRRRQRGSTSPHTVRRCGSR